MFMSNDIYLSYLPMAHIFERSLYNSIAFNGGLVGVASNGYTNLRDDCDILQPTIFATVPRYA